MQFRSKRYIGKTRRAAGDVHDYPYATDQDLGSSIGRIVDGAQRALPSIIRAVCRDGRKPKTAEHIDNSSDGAVGRMAESHFERFQGGRRPTIYYALDRSHTGAPNLEQVHAGRLREIAERVRTRQIL
jgi:hypothetical protein